MQLAEVTWLRVQSIQIVALLALFLTAGQAEYSGTDSSSCGHDSIPYALSVDAQGKPELLCDTSACFGDKLGDGQDGSRWASRLEEMDSTLKKAIDNHTPPTGSTTPSNFAAIAAKRQRVVREAERNYAECSGKLADAVCASADEWTGGVAEVNNGTHIFLQMECCTYAGLSQAAELKSMVLKPGQRFTGGEVLEGGKLVAFDLVKELRKNVSATNEVSYVINIYRMLCAGGARSKTGGALTGEQSAHHAASPPPRLPNNRQTKQHKKLPQEEEDDGEAAVNGDAAKREHMPRSRSDHRHRFEDYDGGDVEAMRHRHQTRRGEVAGHPRGFELARSRMHRLKQASNKYPTAASRRRQLYRPILMGDDEYVEDYYDSFDIVPPYPRRRRPGHRGDGYRASRLRFAEERLWPAFSSYSVGMGGKPRVYGNGAYEPENQIPLKADDDTTIETAATAAAISSPSPASVDFPPGTITSANTLVDQRDLGAPPGISVPSTYVTLVPSSPPSVAQPPAAPLALQGYPTVNTYIPPPPLPQTAPSLAFPLPPASNYPQPSYQQPSYGGGDSSCSCPNTEQKSCSSSYDLASSSSSSSSGCCCKIMIQENTGYSPAYQPTAYTPGYQTEYQNSYYSYPASCFSGDTEVETSVGRKRVDQLAVGDMVTSIDQSMISFSPVVMFLHRKPRETAKFIQISTATGTTLKLTDYHLIYMTDCGVKEQLKLVPAHTLRVGQCAHATSKGNDGHILLHATRILRIEEVEDSGIYAPLTANGDIVVNGILASCHSNMAMQTLQQTFFEWWRKLNAFISFLLPATEHPERNESNPSNESPTEFGRTVEAEDEDLPLGVEYLISVMDTLIPLPIPLALKDVDYNINRVQL